MKMLKVYQRKLLIPRKDIFLELFQWKNLVIFEQQAFNENSTNN